MSNDDEPFLKRWSRRKVEARTGAPEPEVAVDQPPPAFAPGTEPSQGASADVAERKPQLTEADFADVDFEQLDMQSDYTRFLDQGVPEAIKQRALRQLWSSDPIFSSIETFNEYGGDFTDKAVAVAPGALQTAWRVGKGFLTDEEAAVWEKLGVPEKVATAEDATKTQVASAEPADLPAEPVIVATLAANEASVDSDPANDSTAPDEQAAPGEAKEN